MMSSDKIYWITGLSIGLVWFIGYSIRFWAFSKDRSDDAIYEYVLGMTGGTLTAILVGPFLLYLALGAGAIIGLPYLIVKALTK